MSDIDQSTVKWNNVGSLPLQVTAVAITMPLPRVLSMVVKFTCSEQLTSAFIHDTYAIAGSPGSVIYPLQPPSLLSGSLPRTPLGPTTAGEELVWAGHHLTGPEVPKITQALPCEGTFHFMQQDMREIGTLHYACTVLPEQ